MNHKRLIAKVGPGAPPGIGFAKGGRRFGGMGQVYSSANMNKSGQSLNEMSPMEQQQWMAQQQQQEQYEMQMQQQMEM